MRSAAAAAVLALVAALSGMAGASPASRGTTGADVLKIAPGVRGVGMGSSFTAVAEDLTALNWNPAGTGPLLAPEATGAYLTDPVTGVGLFSGGALALRAF